MALEAEQISVGMETVGVSVTDLILGIYYFIL